MTNVTPIAPDRVKESAAERGPSVLIPKTPITPAEADYAARLDDYTLRVVDAAVDTDTGKRPKPYVEKVGDKKFRFSFKIRIHHGSKRIYIILFKHATVQDFHLAQITVERMKAGEYSRYPWREWESKKWPDFTIESTVPGMPLKAATRAWAADSIYATRIRACHEPGCDNYLTSIHIHRPGGTAATHHTCELIEGDGYRVIGTKVGTEGRWKLNIRIDDNVFDPREVPGFISDVQWVTTEIAKLNAALDARVADATPEPLGAQSSQYIDEKEAA